MRFIEDLRDTYPKKGSKKGDNIWIIGSGPSLEYFPENFFNDKIAIALNCTFIPFLQAFEGNNPDTYIHFYHFKRVELIKAFKPHLFKKCIPLWPLENIRQNIDWFGEYKDEPIFMRRPEKTATQQDFISVAKAIIEGRACDYVARKTTLHTGIQVAVILGAKKIILVGCGHSFESYPFHAQGRGLWTVYGPTSLSPPENFELMREGTKWMVEAFEPYGIEIVRYFHSHYEKII